MAEKESGREGEGSSRRLGYEDLSMNVVPTSATEEPSEAGRRAGITWLLLIGVLVAVGLLGWGARLALNMPPGKEAGERLQRRLETLDAWRSATVIGAQYLAGDRLRVDFAPSIVAQDDEGRAQLRKGTIEVMKVLMEERPGRDLYIDGYQGEEQVVRGEYRREGTLVTPSGEPQPDIAVRVRGEPEGGIGALVKPPGARGEGR